MKSLSLAAVATAFAALTACTANTQDASDPSSTDDALTQASAASNIFVATGPGLTGGTAVQLANADTTTCANGTKQGICTVSNVDLSALNLSATEAKSFEKAFFDGKALVKGTLANVNHAIGGGSHAIIVEPTLKVTAGWLGATGHERGTFGQFEQLANSHILCAAGQPATDGTAAAAAPATDQHNIVFQNCPIYAETVLNTKAPVSNVAKLDFSKTGATSTMINGAERAVFGTGILAFGFNQGVARGPMTFEVQEYYLPVGK
jgi:hypothetical protein